MTNRLILFCLLVLLMFHSCAKQDSKSLAQNELQQFYSYSTVDWAKLDTLYYRPYNCDWPDEDCYEETMPQEVSKCFELLH